MVVSTVKDTRAATSSTNKPRSRPQADAIPGTQPAIPDSAGFP